MYPQAIEVAPLGSDVATEVHAPAVRRIELAAANADIVANGARQGVHHVSPSSLTIASAFLEHLRQKSEKCLPHGGFDGMKPSIETTLADHLRYVAVLTQKRTALLDVPTEESRPNQGYGHHFGGGDQGLRTVAVARRLQELVTEAIDGDYGIVQCVLPIPKRLCGLRTGRILSASVGGNSG